MAPFILNMFIYFSVLLYVTNFATMWAWATFSTPTLLDTPLHRWSPHPGSHHTRARTHTDWASWILSPDSAKYTGHAGQTLDFLNLDEL